MKKIKLLMEHIDDEIHDAHTYAELALECRATDPETADLFCKLSTEEMNHMNMLHKEVVRLIEIHRREKGAPPADMMAVYEYLHKRSIEKAEEVGVLQGMYRK